MAAKFIQTLLKRLPLSSRRRKKAGFTLTELLVTILIAGVIISALLSFVVDLVDTERREYSRSETQRDMQTALDFIVDDLRQAVYIYDKVEQPRDNSVGSLTNFIPSIQDAVPVLAFWKAERLPYEDSATQQLPANNIDGCGTNAECKQVLIRRRAYSLVVYYLTKNNNDPKWKGESRLIRYVFRKYPNLPSLSKTSGYVDPAEVSSFQNWPYVNSSPQGSASLPNGKADVLVDFVDKANNTTVKVDKCTSDTQDSPLYVSDPNNPPYRRVPADETKSNSFFVCVKTLGIVAGTNQTEAYNQDVIIYLRGNPKGRINDREQPLLTLKTQAIARGVIDKKPQ